MDEGIQEDGGQLLEYSPIHASKDEIENLNHDSSNH